MIKSPVCMPSVNTPRTYTRACAHASESMAARHKNEIMSARGTERLFIDRRRCSAFCALKVVPVYTQSACACFTSLRVSISSGSGVPEDYPLKRASSKNPQKSICWKKASKARILLALLVRSNSVRKENDMTWKKHRPFPPNRKCPNRSPSFVPNSDPPPDSVILPGPACKIRPKRSQSGLRGGRAPNSVTLSFLPFTHQTIAACVYSSRDHRSKIYLFYTDACYAPNRAQ